MRNIRRKPFDIKSVRLSPEEGFVLSRIDAPTSIRELVALTGLDEGRVVTLVEGLARQGAIEVDRDAGEAPMVPPAAQPPAAQPPAAQPPASQPPASQPQPPAASDADIDREGGDPLDDEETEEQSAKRVAGEAEYRKVYETTFKDLPREERVTAAQTEKALNLFALCFDAEPQVVAAVLVNPNGGLAHARLVASHHHTYAGLDHLGRRSEYLKDAQVERRLLGNPQLPDPMLRRIVDPKPLQDVYKICAMRELPEIARLKARELLQKKFVLASADERAGLLFKTEGRCLVLLMNVALDSRTTQVMTSKTTYSVVFIQNLARWSATPPALLMHLLKQPLVRQNFGLKKMLLKHPNAPAEAKRGS